MVKRALSRHETSSSVTIIDNFNNNNKRLCEKEDTLLKTIACEIATYVKAVEFKTIEESPVQITIEEESDLESLYNAAMNSITNTIEEEKTLYWMDKYLQEEFTTATA